MEKISNEVLEELRDYTQELCEILRERVTVKASLPPTNEVYLNLRGSPRIFTQGEEPFEHLVTFLEIVLRRKHNIQGRVSLDVNGNKKRKLQELQAFARRAASKARSSHSRIRLNPMPSRTRKWIHVTLAEVEGVRTYSVGEGSERRVIIEPTGDEDNAE
ncbi:MAG: R3H domain-containing nucleic acid-binding protein [Candidatus Acetothermia bacterium]